MPDKTTQADIDAAADQLLKEHGYDIDKVIPNKVAVRLGMSKANGALGEAVANWKERRTAEGVPFVTKAPPEMDAVLDVTFENFRRLARGLVGKYRAEDAEAHEQDAGKWSERYDDLEARYHELRRKFEDAESARVSMVDENARLAAELAQAQSAFGKAQAALDEVRKVNDRLLANLGFGSDLGANHGPAPSAGVMQKQTEPDAQTPPPVRRGRGRPRKNPTSSPSGAFLRPHAEDLLPGHAWEQTSSVGGKIED
ncbi:hypothetical protein J3454_15350 [Erythrobacter sp. NFXS35]|uniref:hypothetical protein n=1 Tax=Erythrobacter sp. NFXS35 TaxID=2818436 RepID=UPI0032E03C1D